MPDRMLEDMPERMSEEMSDRTSFQIGLYWTPSASTFEAPRRLKTDVDTAISASLWEQSPGARAPRDA